MGEIKYFNAEKHCTHYFSTSTAEYWISYAGGMGDCDDAEASEIVPFHGRHPHNNLSLSAHFSSVRDNSEEIAKSEYLFGKPLTVTHSHSLTVAGHLMDR